MTDQLGARQRAAATKRLRTNTAIIAAARDLLSTQSWQDFRMEEVAEVAGVSVATVYNHYRTKAVLIAMVFRLVTMNAITKVQHGMGQPDADRTALATQYIYDLVKLAREHHNATAGYVAAILDQTVTPEEVGEYRMTDGNRGSLLRLGMLPLLGRGVPHEVADYHTFGLLTMVVMHPESSTEEIAEVVLSQFLPVLIGSADLQPRGEEDQDHS